MRYIFLIVVFTFCLVESKAYTIKGKIEGLKEGEKIWLYTNRDHEVEHKWNLSLFVDSTVVRQGEFELEVADQEYGRSWLLKAGPKRLKFFFNKDEDIRLQGIAGKELLNDRMEGGRDAVLCEDIFHILDRETVNPVDRREGIEWLKRHAMEDICPFATAYFYMHKKILRPQDVKEIESCLSGEQYKNPYWRTVKEYYRKDVLVQPGKTLPEAIFIDPDGKVLSGVFQETRPLLIYNCGIRNFGEQALYTLKQLLDLQRQLPELRLLLVLAKYPEEIRTSIKEKVAGKDVWMADYEETARACPALYYDAHNRVNMVLVNAGRQIVAHNPELSQCRELLDRPVTDDGFRVEGYILGMTEGVAELVMSKENTRNSAVVVDTAVIRNGYFTFQGKVAYPRYCNIAIRNTSFPVGFYLENSVIEVGIRLNEGVRMKNGVPIPIKALKGEIYGSRAQTEFRYLAALDDEKMITDWITAHPENEPALECMVSLWVNRYPPEVVERWLGKVHPGMKDRPAYREVLGQLAKRRQLAIGMKAPEFILLSASGEKVALKDFRGKYVLVDFWASWCGPCRSEIPNLKKVWKRYQEKGLEIVSITLDQKEGNWRKALGEEQMPWTQLTARGTRVAESYNVQGIPHIVLLDPQGRLVAVNIRGEQLEKKLAEIFK